MSGVYIGVDGTARKIKGGYIGVDGKARKIKKGYIGDENGVARLCWSSEKKLSEYTVGSIVYLLESGKNVEYIVVHQGKPNSSAYDSSCDGTWLLRKDCYAETSWYYENKNNYATSTLNTQTLNTTFLNKFKTAVKSAIKTAAVPVGNSTLNQKIFLLSGNEVGWTKSNNSNLVSEGACLDYFNGCSVTDAKRIANYSNAATKWWTRSRSTLDSYNAFYITDTGGMGIDGVSTSNGIRPALIMNSDTLFDSNNVIVT